MNELASKPRWASELSDETWEQVNEQLHNGLGARDVHRMLKLDDSKLRSLQVHASHFAPRRRLLSLARLKDALLTGGGELGDDLVEVFQHLLRLATTEGVKASVQVKAAAIADKFVARMLEIGEGDEAKAAELEAGRRTKGNREDETAAAIEEIKAIYGLK